MVVENYQSQSMSVVMSLAPAPLPLLASVPYPSGHKGGGAGTCHAWGGGFVNSPSPAGLNRACLPAEWLRSQSKEDIGGITRAEGAGRKGDYPERTVRQVDDGVVTRDAGQTTKEWSRVT
ncbi:hypothetical protein ACOMHN_031556 [Nucella lapillus]